MEISSRLNMFPKAVIVSALRAGCGGHGTIIIDQARQAIATEATVAGSIRPKMAETRAENSRMS
jgi:hypothetical protein